MKPKDSQELFVRNLTGCQPALYGYILSLLPNRNDANDVLQDTNLVLWRRWEEYADGTNFLAWAYKIARYKVLAHHRDHHRDRHVFNDGLFDVLADQAEQRTAAPDGVAGLLDDCMAELSPPHRDLVRERYAPGGSVQEIARRLGQTASVVSVTLSRIRHSLLQCIQRKQVAGRSR
ncbi:MAG: sigma-70 family RNA polymerase sigma factor [Thermoguttaceae bacterium]